MNFLYLLCVPRWLDVLRHSLSVSDGAAGGGAESAGAGQDPALVYHEAAERLPRAPQQTCRHMLLLLGGSYARGTACTACIEVFSPLYFYTIAFIFHVQHEKITLGMFQMALSYILALSKQLG